jgi:hypothetical protein
VDVIERALKTDPSQRYASAGEMLAAMRAGNDSGPLTISTRVPAALVSAPSSPSQLRQTLARGGSAALALFALTLLAGYVACVGFETTFRIDPFFASGFSSYLATGAAAMLPIALIWVAASTVVAVSGAGRHLLATWRGGEGTTSAGNVLFRTDPVILGTAICLVGAVGCVATTMRFFPVFAALEALRTGVAAPADLSALAPGGANTIHGLVSALLSFALGFAAWKWFPALERRGGASATIRALRWATVGVALLTIVLYAMPRRFVWDDFEMVKYENRRAFVLASRGEQLLLYLVDTPGRPLRRVSASAAALERSGETRKLFAPPS